MLKICIIVDGYPTTDDPIYTFIRPVVMSMVDAGNQCVVVAPHSITKDIFHRKHIRPYSFFDKSQLGNKVKIFQPKYASVSNLRVLGVSVSILLRNRAILRCLKKEKINPDLYYAHFWDCGVVACKAAKDAEKPVYVATGESKIRVFDYYKKPIVYENIKNIRGVISVSTKNLEESRQLGLLRDGVKTVILPNAINTDDFHFVSKIEVRRGLGFDLDDKIAVFVGAFSERKGVLRVVQAIEKVPNLKLILIGAGEQTPKSDRIIFQGRVSHNQIYKYLNSADVFVLPTLAEGCCNAIVEAMACGLPIVSSNLQFNWDILDNTNSIMVNPKDIDEIAKAVELIVTDEHVHNKLSKGSLDKSKSLTMESRGRAILDFLTF